MGNSLSSKTIDRHYGNYEKSFERLDKDVQRVKSQLVARGRRRANLGMWSSVLIAGAVVVAAAIIYQVQQQPQGTYSYQEHFQRTGGAMGVPAAALLLHWVVGFWMDLQQRRDTRKLQRLETTQKTMLKELKEMINYDKVKTLIDRFDPDAHAARAAQMAMMQHQQGPAHRMNGAPAGRGGSGHGQGGQRGPQGQGQVPAMLVKGRGQVAGAAALAVAGAGKALMPLVDKLATSLMADNPLLLEDLRQAQTQLQVAQERTMGAMQESLGLKHENLQLKLRLVDLERELKLDPSFEMEALQEQQQQLYQQTQQAAWQVELQQQYLQMPAGAIEGGLGTAGGSQGSLMTTNSSSSDLRPQPSGSKQDGSSTPVGTPKAATGAQ